MAELVTIARPYAEAAFSLAKQRDELGKWSEMLSLMVSVYNDSEFQSAIGAPSVTGADVERLMLSICGERIDGNARNFVQLLVENSRLAAIGDVQRLYEQLKSDDEGVVDAQIASAYPLQDQQLEKIVALLAKRYDKKISPTVDVDAELIGGIKVQVGDKVWDASVRGRLEEMAVALSK
ncbi:MAG: F0F1 ATP synthase subunit delta [Burkholderiales bacterium]|nr:F0F1 ATP synthase subunit delta [Burkholderiales bacterium]